MPVPLTSELESLVQYLSGDPRLVHLERQPPRASRHASLSPPLPTAILEAVGVEHLWCHQVEAIDLVRQRRSVVVATGTASGKSLCYQAPIAEAALRADRLATTLVLVPTKALAQDQLRSFGTLKEFGVVAATYDGDSDHDHRRWVRRHANVVLTNPEMLHHGILPRHERWATFLKRLDLVVVDELHVLRGIFGGHTAHLLRRLRRLADHYGSDPVFVFCSATIGHPENLARDLCGKAVTAVTDDGSPRGERIIVLWDPNRPSLDAPRQRAAADPQPIRQLSGPPGEADARTSARPGPAISSTEIVRPAQPVTKPPRRGSATLAAELVQRGLRTIVFTRSRTGTEVVAGDLRRQLPPELRPQVRSYRGGYLPTERREIEAELFEGSLLGVVATSALELGVDIGGLEACVLDGFPGTVASMWQQVGRAGRGTDTSVAVLVAGNDQLDQWVMSHPDQLLQRPPESAVINLTNPFTVAAHVTCAAYELPLRRSDERWWPDLLDDAVRDLVLDDRLTVRTLDQAVQRAPAHQPIAVWCGTGRPAGRVGLRTGTGHELRITDTAGTLIGTVDRDQAPRLVHPGAIYLHQGQPWQVIELNLADGSAIVEPSDGSTFTQPRTETGLEVTAEDRSRRIGRIRAAVGPVQVVSQVTGYRRLDTRTGSTISTHDLELPSVDLTTRAFWYTFGPDQLATAGLTPDRWAGALHALEHAAIGLLPLFAICDRWDVGGISSPMLASTMSPTVVIYDAYPGGAGVAELGFDSADLLLAATWERLSACSCDGGCPSCVQSPKCGNGNEPLDKAAAMDLLRSVLDPTQAAAA